MTQSPYANIGTELVEPVPQRTSVLAILSLIIAIVSFVPLFCIAPGSGALAVIFGGAALLFINRERGRLSGTGMAATGIVLGLIVTVIQVAVVVTASRVLQAGNAFVAPIDTAMGALDKGDLAGARTMFTANANKQITDEMLTKFTAEYRATAGGYEGLPRSLMDWIQSYANGAQGLKNKQMNNTMPLAAKFDKGAAILAIMMDPTGGSGPQPGSSAIAVPILNIGVLTVDGREVWLIDPATLPAPTRIRIGPRTAVPPPAAKPAAIPEAPTPPESPSSPEKPDDPS